MAKKSSNGANLGFEQKLWASTDKLRNNMDAAEYKHVVLQLLESLGSHFQPIFLKGFFSHLYKYHQKSP
jgi:hypothetical protein